jgi:hypothetical protein
MLGGIIFQLGELTVATLLSQLTTLTPAFEFDSGHCRILHLRIGIRDKIPQ